MKLLLTIILIFVALDVLMIFYVLYRRYGKKISSSTIKSIRQQWKRIIAQPDYRHAIMDADKLLDFALSEMGLRGNLGNKLKRSGHLFSNIDHVWKAHKVRNNIAHQIDYQVTEKAYKQSMLYYKKAFEDLSIF